MSCCRRVENNPPEMHPLPLHYEKVQLACALAITVLAFRALPQTFVKWAALGVLSHLARYVITEWPELSQDLIHAPESCASGCTDIVAQSYKLKFDPRISLLVATIFFCCHIEHHAAEMVPVVGAAFGFRVFHTLSAKLGPFSLGSTD